MDVMVVALEHTDNSAAAKDGLAVRPPHVRSHRRASTASVRLILSAVVAWARAAMARRMSATPA
jgi:hypothetical protein